MLKYFKLTFILLVCFMPQAVMGLETVNVAVLPFAINTMEGKKYLEEKLPGVLANFLRQEGANIIKIDIAPGTRWTEAAKKAGGIRELVRQNGADYGIWGSLTRIGNEISIDAKMISVYESSPPAVFFVEGKGIENLSGMVKELVRKISLKLFKKERVARIIISGNKRIEEDAIKKAIKTKPGDVFLAKSLSEDLKNVYKMGYFDDITILSEDTPKGKIIRFKVKEKPIIRSIHITGNRIYEDKEVLDILNIRRGSILNNFKIRSNVRRIESLYKEKNYHNVKVNYKISSLDDNQADLEFIIDEGEKVRIKSIKFIGNNSYKDDELKDLMKTSEKGFWSWITSSGDLNRDDLNQDIARLTAFYHNNGFIDAKVSDPKIEYDKNWIHITIKIDEGPRYKVGKVAITGDLVLSESLLKKSLKITKETYYNRGTVRNDVLTLTDIYSDEGYAYANIIPRIKRRKKDLIVDLTYDIKKGKQVYFEKIIITGNTKTRDKVIRRQLAIYEQGLYSGKKLKRGIRNLHRLDFFEDVKVNTKKGSGDDKMIVNIEVREKPTGTFSFGGGYSSTENLFAMASVSQRNLFGLGQILQLRAELGSETTRFTLSFTEPWLFDIPLSAGFDIYNWRREYDTYDKDSVGGALRFGYPVWDYTRIYLTYRYDISDIRNITDDASKEVKELEGENVTSSVTATLKYDSRDRTFNPTQGGEHSISVEYAGLGGDIGFFKVVGEAGQYFPLFWGTVGYLRVKGGYVTENSGMILPDYEKFYLGGINSVRGFKWRDISLQDEDGADVGGYKFFQFNAEYHVPLLKQAGLIGIIFYDTGNVFDQDENIQFDELRQSAGGGFRWYSPMGPMRIEYGWILDRKEGEGSGRWEFAMGNVF